MANFNPNFPRDLDNTPINEWTEEEKEQDAINQQELRGFEYRDEDSWNCLFIMDNVFSFMRMNISVDKSLASIEINNPMRGSYHWRIYEGQEKYEKFFHFWKQRIVKRGGLLVYVGKQNIVHKHSMGLFFSLA